MNEKRREAQSGAGLAPARRRPDRFLALDSLRGVCALAVALFHYPIASEVAANPFVREAFLFVDFFFVLSGFVIARAYENRLADGRQRASFVIKRFGRIWPLHVVVLAVFVLASAAKGQIGADERHSVAAIFTNLTLIHGLGVHHDITWNGPSWSISVEAALYLTFLALSAARWRVAAYVVLIAVSLGVLALVAPLGMNSTYDFGVFRGLAGFFTGAIVARLPLRRMPTLVEAAVLAGVVAFVTLGQALVLAPFVFGLAVWVFADGEGRISRVLTLPPFLRLGEWSYSIYLVHAAVVALVWALHGRLGLTAHDEFWLVMHHHPLLRNLAAVPYLAVVVGVSACTFTFIENPARRAFARLASGRATPANAAATKPA